MAKPIPDGYHTLTPTFMYKDTRKAIDFYKKAFGATEKFLMPGPDGKGVMHAQVQIGDSIIMMGDEQPHCKSAESLGNTPVGMYMYVKDVDAAFKKALAAGGAVRMPVTDMFWGDRMGAINDPFGYSWTIATHIADPTQEEMARGAEEMFAGAGK
jgi:uncharacterized glyoxalase superfamily protein PhnB